MAKNATNTAKKALPDFVFQVTFYRYEDDHQDFADQNFPNVVNALERCRLQLARELEDEPSIANTFTINSMTEHTPPVKSPFPGLARWTAQGTFTIKDFNGTRSEARTILRSRIQRSYDEFGMSGSFKVTD